MPIGEDIPILIPISIVLVVFLVFLFALFSNFSEQSEIVKMSQISLNTGEYLINKHPNLSSDLNKLNGTYLYELNFPKEKCENKKCEDSKLKYLLDMNTHYKISVRIETKEDCWCWNKLNNVEKVVSNSLPVLIENNSETIPAKVVVSVGR